nr:putative ribonuclease H-like domain-containing protein [Tanacetum cinerariifolium]
MMDDPNITMEEYIRIQTQKARRHGRIFPNHVYNDAFTSNENVSSDPTIWLYHPENRDIYGLGLTEEMGQTLADKMRVVYTGTEGRARRRMTWREFILALGLHTTEEMVEVGFKAYWLGNARAIPDKGDPKDYWNHISSDRDFLGVTPYFTFIQDLVWRLCHKLISYSISSKGQAPMKVTANDLFYLRSIDQGRRTSSSGLERQSIAGAGAPEVFEGAPDVDEGAQAVTAPVQAPHPPLAATRTMPQRMTRLEGEVHVMREALGEKRVIMKYFANNSKKARILKLKRRNLKNTILTSNTPYPSRKIRRIYACTSQETTKNKDLYVEEVPPKSWIDMLSHTPTTAKTWLFLAYASFKDFVVYQMDVKSDFLCGKIEEEVYVCQPPGFKDPDFPDRVYKVKKALYGLHQAPRAWFTEVKNASKPMETQKPLIKDEDGEKVDVHMYRSMIGSLMYLTSSRPDIMFAVCACARYQVTPKVSHLHTIKKIFRYLKGHPKLGLWYPNDSRFDLVAYTYIDHDGASLDRKSTTGGCQFLGCRLISWQCKKQTVVANSTTKAEYVAALNGKEIIITESSVRSDLRLADEEGVDCLSNSTIYENFELMGKPKRKNTQVPQPSSSTKHVADEAVYKELNDKLVRASTTASSLEAEQDRGGGPRCQDTIKDTIVQTRFENVSKLLNDSLLARGNTLQSDEDRMKLNELMELCTNLQTRVLKLDKTKTTQALEITSLKRRVKKLVKKKRSRTYKLQILYKGRKINDIDADEDITLVNDQDDAEMFDVNDLHGEEVNAAGEVNVASIATTVTKRAKEKRNKPLTQAQQRKIMCTYLKNVEGKKLKDLKNKSFDTIQKMFDRAFKRVNTFVDFKTKLVEGSSKRARKDLTRESAKKQKVGDDKETAELKHLMEIIPNEEEVAIDAIPLAVKSPRIVD